MKPDTSPASVAATAGVEATPTQTVDEVLLRQYLGYRLKLAYLPVLADARLAVEPLGLRIATSSALHIVVGNPGISQSQLALALNIERSRVVLLVDELEKLGLITRNKVPGDRRSYALCATSAGEALFKQASDALLEHEERVFAGLTEAERRQLTALLDKVHQSITDSTES